MCLLVSAGGPESREGRVDLPVPRVFVPMILYKEFDMNTRNNKKWFWLAVSFAITGLAITPVLSDTNPYDYAGSTPPGNQADAKEMEMHTRAGIEGRTGSLQSVRKLTGKAVYNPQQEKLAAIHEVILDDTKHTVVYAVLSANDCFYPVPWTALDTGLNSYVLDILPENLAMAPSLKVMDTAILGSADFEKKVHDFYSKQIDAVQKKGFVEKSIVWMHEKKVSVTGKPENIHLSSTLRRLGMDVENLKNETIGELHDILFDVRQGNLAYGLVSFGGFLGFAEKTAAVPWSAFRYLPDRGVEQLHAERQTLEAVVIPKNNHQKLNEPLFARQVHDRFDQEPYWDVYGFVAPTEEPLSDRVWLPDSSYNRRFDASSILTLSSCTIKKIGSFTPEPGSTSGLKLKVAAPDGRLHIIHAGPQTHYLQQDIRFKTGEQITVTGSKVKLDEKTVILATEIRRGDEIFLLRDAQGKPLWKLQMPEEHP